jgi:superfamily I DNA and RNA helicase
VDQYSDFEGLRCRIIDAEEARTTTHREVLLILAQTFDDEGAVLLCEPSIVRGRSGPPDIAIVDPKSGVHVVEIKGVPLDSVRAVNAGGAIEITYGSNISRKDPSRQATRKMFEIKDAAALHFGGDLNIAFQSWVVFPRITRSEWEDKFGEAVSTRTEVLFADDLESSRLGERLRERGINRLAAFKMHSCPAQQMRSVMGAFGDSEVLRPPSRSGPKPPAGSKGERLDKALAEYRALTELQQRLTAKDWNDGPRLVRGVAGSGKTIVLATQAARLVEQIHKRTIDLFRDNSPVPVLAVCFNRTLVPFIRDRIELAYRQRTHEALPGQSLVVLHFNALLYHLHRQGFCKYRRTTGTPDADKRAMQCLVEMNSLRGERAAELSRGLFAAVFIDEGQDFHESEYRLLMKLGRPAPSGLPRMFVFYDDAQNLYGLKRPTWSELGIDMRGRSVVMDECFRNTRQIIEPAFNVLLGTYAAKPHSVRTHDFADLATLEHKKLITRANDHVRVHFSAREGAPVLFRQCKNKGAEEDCVAMRCDELMKRDGLLPQDILVLTYRRDRALQLAEAIAVRIGEDKVRCPFKDDAKDTLAIEAGKIAVSTVASSKGYDAPQVLLVSINDFATTIEGRASFYVGCTRAREWLEVSATKMSDLAREFQSSASATNSGHWTFGEL